MDLAILLFGTFASITLIFFARNERYYQKTVEAYGNKFAEKIFKTLKIGGYLMLIGATCMTVLIL